MLFGSASAPLFSVNLWGLASALVFAAMVANLFGLRNGSLLIWGDMFMSIMLGRIISSVQPPCSVTARFRPSSCSC